MVRVVNARRLVLQHRVLLLLSAQQQGLLLRHRRARRLDRTCAASAHHLLLGLRLLVVGLMLLMVVRLLLVLASSRGGHDGGRGDERVVRVVHRVRGRVVPEQRRVRCGPRAVAFGAQVSSVRRAIQFSSVRFGSSRVSGAGWGRGKVSLNARPQCYVAPSGGYRRRPLARPLGAL